MKPIYVATPFPPLNFNQIGKICPNIAKELIKIIIKKYSKLLIYKFVIKNTGKNPFNISSKRVHIAKYFFPVLNTLVAPMLPDPISLTSCFINTFVIIKPKGTDPHRYDIKITNI